MKETFSYFETAPRRERAALVTLITHREDSARETARDHLEELALLADTAGADVVFQLTQERPTPDVALYLGKGKVDELKQHIEMMGVDIVIFDDELSPMQVRNLEKALAVRVVDRATLILDIFASRARTREAKTQIELAQLEYLLPRLTRAWTHFSKQQGGVGAKGGIGTKGPGETQIETDRRLIKTRISYLKEKLGTIEQQQRTRREGRSDELARIALVGYTNAGKSSLLNTVAEDHTRTVFVENRLFATLDATTRYTALSQGRKALVTDTVGFIRKLPARLIASFRTTLSEVEEADILLHVIDVSSPQREDHIQVVNETLAELGALQTPTIMVFNKIDLLDPEERAALGALRAKYPHVVCVSAARGIGISKLKEEIEKVINEASFEIVVEIPLEHFNVATRLHELAEVVDRVFTETHVRMTLRVHGRNRMRVERLLSVAA